MEGLHAVRPQWLKDGSIHVLAQLASHAMPEVPAGVPLVTDFVTGADDRKVLDVIFLTTLLARPFIAPPGIPDDRVAALREGFVGVMQDADFLAEMATAQVEVGAMSGAEMQQHVRAAYALPGEIVEKVRGALAE
jgi:hypothetical protein